MTTEPDAVIEQSDSNVVVTLIGKPDCHLCADARAIIERVCDELHVPWNELSILDNPLLASKYFEAIPVTLIDGKVHDQWRVDEVRFRSALLAKTN